MKYPVGTKCWLVRTGGAYTHLRGRQTTVISHEHSCVPCYFCESKAHNALIDLPGLTGRLFACCMCALVPIDDPDAGKAVEEDLALPFDPRKMGEPA